VEVDSLGNARRRLTYEWRRREIRRAHSDVSYQEESERWQRNCKGGIFGFMSKPALNIDDLSPEERLRLIEELWDSLNETPGTVPLTNAQREELDRRLDDLERSGPEGIPWDQVLQQIRSRSR
jgi:putative addiction module component (TIGR02574 family)